MTAQPQPGVGGREPATSHRADSASPGRLARDSGSAVTAPLSRSTQRERELDGVRTAVLALRPSTRQRAGELEQRSPGPTSAQREARPGTRRRRLSGLGVDEPQPARLQLDGVDPRAQRLVLDRRVQHARPARQELLRAEALAPARRAAALIRAPAPASSAARSPAAASSVDVAGGHQEAVDAVGDLLARAVLDVVGSPPGSRGSCSRASPADSPRTSSSAGTRSTSTAPRSRADRSRAGRPSRASPRARSPPASRSRSLPSP